MTRHNCTVTCNASGEITAADVLGVFATAFELADGRAAVCPVAGATPDPQVCLLTPGLAAAWTDLLAYGRDTWRHRLSDLADTDLHATLHTLAPRAVSRATHRCQNPGCTSPATWAAGEHAGEPWYCGIHAPEVVA